MNKKKSSQKVFWSGQSFSLKLPLFEKQKISVTGWKTQFQSVQLSLCFVVVTQTTRKDRNGQYKDQLTKLPWITPAADQKQTKKLKIWVPKMIFVLGISKDKIPAKQVTWKDISKNSASRPNVSKPWFVNREDTHVLESCFDAEVICSQAN